MEIEPALRDAREFKAHSYGGDHFYVIAYSRRGKPIDLTMSEVAGAGVEYSIEQYGMAKVVHYCVVHPDDEEGACNKRTGRWRIDSQQY